MSTTTFLPKQLIRVLALALLFVSANALTARAQKVADTPENKAKAEYNEGLKLAKTGDFTGALKHFEEGLKLDPKNSKNYYMKAFALRKLDQHEESIAWYQKAHEAAVQEGEKTIAAKAQENIGAGYIAMAALALQNNKASQAVEHLKKAAEFGEPDSDTHFYYARAYNTLGNFELAADHARKGAELEKGGALQKAKYFFELGNAYKNLGQKDQARNAFQQAAHGPYKKSAEYEISLL